ncbi:ABC-type sugar transport system permease subunit [Pseudarthrobacter siccitolerans]|uniref:ABC-type sugar transport system permease subunit n=1 Tax=Pseudarthrobacter siccitolerans TaxID=861266 RepID=A0ABU0PME8_9MICC|nr:MULTISPECIES: sugar ABC transporter permease [Micrococcaceae]MDQ0675130.1 ABC-type sugar transport system permease subunit [Pseudarthrobacter siccitolerans]MDQ0733337.1 ABC-type sugar transport system permease subunit [Arthrobacter sp. B1I2]
MTSQLEIQPRLHSPLRQSRRSLRRNSTGWLFLAPAVLLIAALTVIPFGQAILLSFQEWDGISPDSPFVGLDNYSAVLKDQVFWASMGNVLVFAVVGFFLGNGIALAMAIAVNKVPRAKAFFRTAFYLPGAFSVVVVGLIYSWLLEPRIGIVNRGLEAIGAGSLSQNWLGNPEIALFSVALVFVWYHWGFAFILFLAGLQDIPNELYEAASLDGAPGRTKFRYITWPHLAPVTSIVSVLTLLSALQVFGTVQVLTNGGPGYHTMVPTLQIYIEAFANHRYGTAAAMSVLFGGALVVLSLVQLGISRRSSRA